MRKLAVFVPISRHPTTWRTKVLSAKPESCCVVLAGCVCWLVVRGLLLNLEMWSSESDFSPSEGELEEKAIKSKQRSRPSDDSTDTGKYFREGSYQTFYENIACI